TAAERQHNLHRWHVLTFPEDLAVEDVAEKFAALSEVTAVEYNTELKQDATYMNQVRKRAGLADVTYSNEAVVAERHREFMGEGLRYWDLLRQGVDYAASEIAGTWTVLSGNKEDVVTISADRIKATKGLCRIPDNQITLSGNVYTQNDGWK
ncbi:MAG: RagB/SusD family nutrient uptake outer membrane protein, partial [Bacteroidales bacterium]|nr:RagB/SusD family nutrient uptake outer membrane protein [Bacteroidales bacterium]